MVKITGAVSLLSGGCKRAKVRTVVLKGDPVNEVLLKPRVDLWQPPAI